MKEKNLINEIDGLVGTSVGVANQLNNSCREIKRDLPNSADLDFSDKNGGFVRPRTTIEELSWKLKPN